jgi:hypothetical protein
MSRLLAMVVLSGVALQAEPTRFHFRGGAVPTYRVTVEVLSGGIDSEACTVKFHNGATAQDIGGGFWRFAHVENGSYGLCVFGCVGSPSDGSQVVVVSGADKNITQDLGSYEAVTCP